MQDVAIVLLGMLVAALLNIYLIVGAVLTIDSIVYLRSTRAKPKVTVGRVVNLVLFWLPILITSNREKG